MPPNVGGWRVPERRDLLGKLAPTVVQPPHQRGQPGEAPFDQRHLQRRKLLEHAFANQADDLGLKGLGHAPMVLDVVGGPAGPRNGSCSGAPKMDAHRQLAAQRGLIDLAVPGPPQGLVGPNQQEDLNESRMASHPIDLLRRQIPILVGNDNGGAQPGLRFQPFGDLPVVDRPGQRGSVLQVELTAGPVKAVEDAVSDVIGVQQLLPHEFQIRARRQSRRRPGIVPGGVHQRPRIISSQMAAQSEPLMVPAPALRQVLVEGLIGGDDVVDVAVDDLQLRLFATGRGWC